MEFEAKELFATVATSDKPEAGCGVIWWTTHPEGHYALTVVDYDIFDVSSINADWLETFFARCADLAEKHQPSTRGCFLRVEHPGLKNVLKRADAAFRETSRGVDRSVFEILPVKDHEAAKWPNSLDERAFHIRPIVASGKVVKIETGLKRFSFRSIRTNHLLAQIKSHRPGDAASAGELLHAFVLGVLLGTAPKRGTIFDLPGWDPRVAKSTSTASKGPFGTYITGRRPL